MGVTAHWMGQKNPGTAAGRCQRYTKWWWPQRRQGACRSCFSSGGSWFSGEWVWFWWKATPLYPCQKMVREYWKTISTGMESSTLSATFDSHIQLSTDFFPIVFNQSMGFQWVLPSRNDLNDIFQNFWIIPEFQTNPPIWFILWRMSLPYNWWFY